LFDGHISIILQQKLAFDRGGTGTNFKKIQNRAFAWLHLKETLHRGRVHSLREMI